MVPGGASLFKVHKISFLKQKKLSYSITIFVCFVFKIQTYSLFFGLSRK
jgi:hypothetical protein